MVVVKLPDLKVAASPKARASVSANLSCLELELVVVDAAFVEFADATSKVVVGLAFLDAVVVAPDEAVHMVMDVLGLSEDTEDNHTCLGACVVAAGHTLVGHAGHDSVEMPLTPESLTEACGTPMGTVAAYVRRPLIPASLVITRQFKSERAVVTDFQDLIERLT